MSPRLEAPPAPPGPTRPGAAPAAPPQPHSGPAGTAGRASPAPARSRGSDRVVVGVPQADGVREEAAGEVQRHALHVADGAHPGPAPSEAPSACAPGMAGAGAGRRQGPPAAQGRACRTPRTAGFIHAETGGCGLQSQYCYCLF